MLNKQDHERLIEVREEMMNLLEEAKNIIQSSGERFLLEEAKAYWIGHIDSAIGGGNYIDNVCTMEKTIIALDPCDDEYKDEIETEGIS